MRRAALLLAGLLLALGPAAAAVADVRVVPFADTQRSISNPVLLPDGSVIVAGDGWDGVQRVLRVDPGQPPRVLAELPRVDLKYAAIRAALTLSLVASEQAVGVGRLSETCGGKGCAYGMYDTHLADALVGTLGGPVVPVPCAGEVIAASGDLLALSGGCTAASERVGASLWRPGSPEPIRLAPSGQGIGELRDGRLMTIERVAGRTHVAVHDAATGAAVRSLALDGEHRAFLGDGDVVVSARGAGDAPAHLVVHAPGQEPRPVDAPWHLSEWRGLADDRALFVDGGRVGLVDLSGATAPVTTPLPIARPSRFGGVDEPPRLSLSGDRIATVSRPCQTGVLVIRDLTDPLPPELTRPCPVVEPVGPARLKGKTLRVRLRCPVDPLRGCAGHLTVWLNPARRPLRYRDRWGSGQPVAMASGSTATFRVHFGRATRRFERRYGFDGVRIAVTPDVRGLPDGVASPPLERILDLERVR